MHHTQVHTGSMLLYYSGHSAIICLVCILGVMLGVVANTVCCHCCELWKCAWDIYVFFFL